MKQLTINDVRNALLDMLLRAPQNMPDEDLLEADFWFDLKMDEQQVMLLAVNLQRTHHILLPKEVFDSLKGQNSVRAFLSAANQLLQDLDVEK